MPVTCYHMKLIRNYKRVINRQFESLVEHEILIYDSEHDRGKILKIDQPGDFEEKRESSASEYKRPQIPYILREDT